MEILHSENVDGYRLNVMQDIEPESPRDWDNLGTMVCFHGSYTLGDDNHGYRAPQDLQDYLDTFDGVALPLYLYDHSGITISTTSFSCPWDSGQVGYIFVTMDTIRENWKGTDAEIKEKAVASLQSEVKTYDQYLTDDVYGYDLLEICDHCGSDSESVGSCWGFYGQDDCIKEARAELSAIIEHNQTVKG